MLRKKQNVLPCNLIHLGVARAELFQAATQPRFFSQSSADGFVNALTKMSEIKIIFSTGSLHTVFVQQFCADEKLTQCVL